MPFEAELEEIRRRSGRMPLAPEVETEEEEEKKKGAAARIAELADNLSKIPSRGAPAGRVGTPGMRFRTPLDVPIPEGYVPADPEESSARAAVRGAFRTAQETMQFFEPVFDPMAPLKRKVGIPTFAESTAQMVEDLGIDLREIQIGRGFPRIAEKLGEEAVAAGMTSVPVFRAARAARGSTLLERRFIGPLLRYAAEAPGRFAVSETAAAAGSAIARSQAEETFKQQLATGVVGAGAPAVLTAPTRLVGRGVRALWSARDPTRRGQRIVSKAAREMADLVGGETETAAQRIERTLRETQAIPGMEPTTVQAARGEPGLKAFEQRVTTGPSERAVQLNKTLTARRAATQEAVVEGLADLAEMNRFETGRGSLMARVIDDSPPISAEKEIVDAQLRARAEQAAAVYEDAIEESQRRVEQVVGRTTARGRSSDFAVRLLDELENESERVFQPIKEAYDSLDDYSEAVGLRGSNAPLREMYRRILKGKTIAEGTGLTPRVEATLRHLTGTKTDDISDLGEEVVGLLGGHDALARMEDFGDYVPFRELRGLRRRINRDIRQLRRNPEARYSVGQLILVRDVIDRTLNITEAGTDALRFVRRIGERGVTLAEARRVTREYESIDRSFGEAAERFRRGVTGQILEPQKGPPAASATAGLYFRPGRGKGQREAAENFLKVARDNPVMQQTMDDYIIASAWEATNDPTKGPVARNLRRFVAQHDEALRAFPETRRKLSNIGSLVEEVEQRRLERKAYKKSFEESAAGRWLNGNPRRAVARIIDSGNPASEARKIMEQIGDAEGRRGFARVFWSELWRRSVRYGDLGPGTSLHLEPNAFHKLVDRFAPVIAEVQGPEHVRNLRKIADLAEVAYQGKIPETARAQQRNLIERVTSGQIPIGWVYNRIYNFRTRALRGGLLLGRYLAKLDRGHVEALLDEALVDPQMAISLLRHTPTQQAERVAIRRLRGNLISLGYRVPEMEEETEEVQP